LPIPACGRFFELTNFILRTLDWQIPQGFFDLSFLGVVYGLLEPVGFCDWWLQVVHVYIDCLMLGDHTLQTPCWDRNQWGGGEDTRENIQGGATPTPRGPAPLHTYTHARGGRCQLPLLVHYVDQEYSLEFLHEPETVYVVTVPSVSS
jgi:hypothetical protein